MKKICIAAAVLVATLASCGDTQDMYSSAPVRLIFDNSTHNNPSLAAAMTPYSGVFATITLSGKQFVITTNQGTSATSNMTAVDERRGVILGLNNGIIVGYGTSTDGTFYAYDRECPNCFDVNALPVRSYKISVSEFGIGSCSNCHRQYDLNNGGIVSAGDAGKKLTRYYATTTGPNGVLNI